MSQSARAGTATAVPAHPEPSRTQLPRRATLVGSRRRAQAIALTPLSVLLGVLTIIPTGYILASSFTNAAVTNPETGFVWFQNYAEMFGSADYWETLGRTVFFVIFAVVLQLGIGLALAVAISALKRGDAIIRAIILLPMAAAPIAMLFTWRQILNAAYGPLNYLLGLLGVPPIDWLGDAALALPTLVVVDTWQWTPFIFIILAGGLATVPQDVYEAAAVDGSTPWQNFIHITLPLLMPYIAVAVLFRTIDALKTFDSVQVLTSGGPGSATTMLNYSIFQQGISFLNFGKASAAAVVFLIVSIVLTKMLLSFLTRKERS